MKCVSMVAPTSEEDIREVADVGEVSVTRRLQASVS